MIQKTPTREIITTGDEGLLRTRQPRPRALSMMPLTRSASQDEVGYEKGLEYLRHAVNRFKSGLTAVF
ncbi:hypothetical protein TELCIR_07993 [Teladorsagia circumcincta]|uniref:Uncharacterized protein n=1 Tax=Teladorsagia circumcincta TaxID=45464 RepID=A0A2G9UK99_TELCI|nr:hypothetical protein TELCIR_07993 [Teladorsagia circumcincta]